MNFPILCLLLAVVFLQHVIAEEKKALIEPEWEISEWSPCSKECDGGIQTRTLKCMISWHGKRMQTLYSECDKKYGRPERKMACNTQSCDESSRKKRALIEPEWEISEWSPCSKECDGGIQTRTLKCLISWHGKKMETLYSECDKKYGRPERKMACNTQSCDESSRKKRALIEPEWEISEWSPCSKECDGGIQTRTLKCMISWHGKRMQTLYSECDKKYGRPERKMACNTQSCDESNRKKRAFIEPEWESSEWSPCSKECGGGIQTRTLKCLIPWHGRKMETLFSECDKKFGRLERERACNAQEC